MNSKAPGDAFSLYTVVGRDLATCLDRGGRRTASDQYSVLGSTVPRQLERLGGPLSGRPTTSVDGVPVQTAASMLVIPRR